MDLKAEIRRRIAKLTQLAYERGCRGGAQSALAEIETATAEELVDHRVEASQAIGVAASLKKEPAVKTKRQKAENQKHRKKAAKATSSGANSDMIRTGPSSST